MRWKITHFVLIFLVIFISFNLTVSKRAIGLSGRGRGGSKSSPFGRRKSPSSNDNPSVAKPAPAPKPDSKPSAPHETHIKKDTAQVQQSSHGSPAQNQPQPPVGWNVPGHNGAPGGAPNTPYTAGGGFRSGYQTNQAPPAYSPAGGYNSHYGAAPPSYGGHSTYGAPPAYSPHAPQYGGQGGYHHPGGYPQQSWGGGYQSHGMMGGMGGGMAMGGMGGMGGGGFGHGGGFGSPFGGGGGYGGHGYPMKQSSGFFSGSTVRNLLIGYVAYKAISGVGSLMFHRPYSVVNYYNMPADMKVPEKFELPSNVLTLCDANVTSFCPPETMSVCTSNGTIICAATMDQRIPCQDNTSMLCVNTTIPCMEPNDPLCQNSTQKDQLKTVVDMPCLTNMTLDVNLLDKTRTTPNTNYVYCVTSMAVAGPEYKVCPDLKDSTNDYRSVLNENYEWWLEHEGFRKNYTVYNYKHPMDSKGDIHMPISVLTNCSTNATNICAPNTTHICTTFNEVMCLAPLDSTSECEDEDDTVCIGTTIPCTHIDEDHLCDNKTEGEKFIEFDIPCFVNITINAPIPNFVLNEFNGTLPAQTMNTSYSYHYNYCVITLALPSAETSVCITEETKKLHDKKND